MKIQHKRTVASVERSLLEPAKVALDLWPYDNSSGVYVRLTPKEARKLAKLLRRVADAVEPKNTSIPIPRVRDAAGDWWELQPDGTYTIKWDDGRFSAIYNDYSLDAIKEAHGLWCDPR